LNITKVFGIFKNLKWFFKEIRPIVSPNQPINTSIAFSLVQVVDVVCLDLYYTYINNSGKYLDIGSGSKKSSFVHRADLPPLKIYSNNTNHSFPLNKKKFN